MGRTQMFLGLAFLMALGCAGRISESEAPRISKESLLARLDAPDVVVLDVRGAPSAKAPELRIRGSLTEDPDDFKSWAEKYERTKTVVLYCA